MFDVLFWEWGEDRTSLVRNGPVEFLLLLQVPWLVSETLQDKAPCATDKGQDDAEITELVLCLRKPNNGSDRRCHCTPSSLVQQNKGTILLLKKNDSEKTQSRKTD